MKLDPLTRDILRQYKALINARRRDAGQRELTTAQVMDEICEYMTCQCAVYIGGHLEEKAAKHEGWRGSRLSVRAKKPAGLCLRGKDSRRASRCSPSFSPSDSDGVHLQQISISVGGCHVRTESRGNIERRSG